MIQLTISELMYISDSAKALGSKNFMWYRDKLVGVDDLNYIVFLPLTLSKLTYLPMCGIVMNQKELSKFIKSLSTEGYFDFDDSITNGPTKITSNVGINLNMMIDARLQIAVQNHIQLASKIDSMLGPEWDASQTIMPILSKMVKASAPIRYQYDSNHMIFLFSGIIPILSKDKLYTTLIDDTPRSFIIRYRVKKKNAEVFVYVHYMKL